MATTIRQFNIELYEEHLEEASFLYEQRIGLLDDHEVTWLDIGEFEGRFEAHIDALVVGADLALEVAKNRALEGDFGELHAAVRVFCRHERRDLLDAALEALDPDEAERVRSVADALAHELPRGWEGDMVRLLAAKEGTFLPIAARVLGYRRIGPPDPLLDVLDKAPPAHCAGIAWALGRLGDPKARGVLLHLLSRTEDPELRERAAIALLRLHTPEALETCLSRAAAEEWPLVPLALGGAPSAAAVVLPRLLEPSPPRAAFISAAAIGDAAGVPSLLALLAGKESAEPAALALHVLTGAELWEDAFIPDEIDEDALLEEEIEKLRRGEPLTPPGQSPPGASIRRISQDPAVWNDWWKENRSRFRPGVRYRSGKPCSPEVLLENLHVEASPHPLRRLACEELAIRYGCEVGFETDLLVIEQKKALARASRWVESHAQEFAEGGWYLGARPLAAPAPKPQAGAGRFRK